MQTKKNILPLIAVFVFTAALASIIIWFVLNRNKTENIDTLNNQPIESVTPTEVIPTAIPTPIITEISKTLKLQVLNATEINGQAATLKAKLVSLGFLNITIGNSKEIATENEIKLKTSLSTASIYFQNKMPDFPATITTDLKEASTYDVVFIIGTDLSSGASAALTPPSETNTETATPTKKPTATPTIE